MGLREYLEIFGAIIGIILFLSPIVFALLNGRLMPAVHKAITDNNKEIKKEFRYELKKSEDNIISIARNMVKDEVSENEIQQEKERELRSETYVEKIDNLKTLMARNDERRKEENEAIFETLDSIKIEINSLSKSMVNHESRLIENKEKINEIAKKV